MEKHPLGVGTSTAVDASRSPLGRRHVLQKVHQQAFVSFTWEEGEGRGAGDSQVERDRAQMVAKKDEWCAWGGNGGRTLGSWSKGLCGKGESGREEK